MDIELHIASNLAFVLVGAVFTLLAIKLTLKEKQNFSNPFKITKSHNPIDVGISGIKWDSLDTDPFK